MPIFPNFPFLSEWNQSQKKSRVTGFQPVYLYPRTVLSFGISHIPLLFLLLLDITNKYVIRKTWCKMKIVMLNLDSRASDWHDANVKMYSPFWLLSWAQWAVSSKGLWNFCYSTTVVKEEKLGIVRNFIWRNHKYRQKCSLSDWQIL